MDKLTTRHFSKWADKQDIPDNALSEALDEVAAGNYEASLGGYIYKKRLRFKGQGKSGSARTIICFKKDHLAIYIHGFAKNEKDNLSPKELVGFKETSKVLVKLTSEEIKKAITKGIFRKV